MSGMALLSKRVAAKPKSSLLIGTAEHFRALTLEFACEMSSDFSQSYLEASFRTGLVGLSVLQQQQVFNISPWVTLVSRKALRKSVHMKPNSFTHRVQIVTTLQT